jgi:hypothetical protein
MSHLKSAVSELCGLKVGINVDPPPPGPMILQWSLAVCVAVGSWSGAVQQTPKIISTQLTDAIRDFKLGRAHRIMTTARLPGSRSIIQYLRTVLGFLQKDCFSDLAAISNHKEGLSYTNRTGQCPTLENPVNWVSIWTLRNDLN